METMKRIRFRDRAGSVRTGQLHDDTISVTGSGREFDLDEVDVLPPTEPTTVVGIGRNFETRFGDDIDEDLIPPRPRVFLKTPGALVGHGDTVRLPVDDEEIIYEGELAIVIGTQCANVSESEAMDVVAGFTCANDITKPDGETIVARKAFDQSLPVGPCVVPPEDVPADATIELRINGETQQHDTRDSLRFGTPEIVAAVSRMFTLEPGDVIATGTPRGTDVLNDGDTVEVEIEGIGTLEHDVEAI